MSDERASRLADLRSRVSQQLAAVEDAEEDMVELDEIVVRPQRRRTAARELKE